MIRLFDSNELACGQVRQVELEGRAPLAIYHLDDGFYATDDTCTHGEASLAEGDISGGEIVCPFHYGAFDIRTGAASMPPCDKALRTYPIRIEDGGVFVILDE